MAAHTHACVKKGQNNTRRPSHITPVEHASSPNPLAPRAAHARTVQFIARSVQSAFEWSKCLAQALPYRNTLSHIDNLTFAA